MSWNYDAEKLAAFEVVLQAFAGARGRGWLRRPCPRCEIREGKPDIKHSLGYNTATGGFSCFRCGIHGSLPRNWRAKLELMDPPEAVGIEPVAKPIQPAEGYIPIFMGDGATAEVFAPARDYILQPRADGGRGMSWDTAAAMGIGAALGGKLAGRVIIPITDPTDARKPWLGWVARDYTGRSELPYRYPTGMVRIGLLFNELALYVETDDPVVVVEGVFDTTRLYPDAVACLGKPLESHLPKFRAARRPIVVALDGDAWEEALALSWTLRHYGLRAGSLRLPPKADPDEMEDRWLTEQIAAALRA